MDLPSLVSQSGRFHSIGSLEFSDFWYQGSFLLLLKTDGAGFSKKNFFGQIGVKNRHFLAFLGNQSFDFSDFLYETRLI